mmetsp:Transcript_70573/g.132058  ORF Transcript_70573/g.132058 Transcript_70573/m.132058 type:complete len:442 (+) Transcript_70573:49-1374(+)
MVEVRHQPSGYPALRRAASGQLKDVKAAPPKVPARPSGVSTAFLVSFLGEEVPKCRPLPPQQAQQIQQLQKQQQHPLWLDDAKVEEVVTTRAVAVELKRRQQQVGERPGSAGGLSHVETLEGQPHWLTGERMVAPASTHVAHAWDAKFEDLVNCLLQDSGGDLAKSYAVDVFTTRLTASLDDPVGAVRDSVFGASEVLLVLDAEGLALRRLFVLFEVMLAHACGKLRVTCSAPGGWGVTEQALRKWEERIDAIDWVLAETTRKADDRRLRAASERLWEKVGKDAERLLASLRKELRQVVYSEVLISSTVAGKLPVVKRALEMGADPEHKDQCGNLPEDVAAFMGRNDIEEVIFSWRMRHMSHKPLRLLLDPQENGRPQLDMAPFMTEPLLEDDEDDEPFPDWLAQLGGMIDQAARLGATPSTTTPGQSGANSSRSSSTRAP